MVCKEDLQRSVGLSSGFVPSQPLRTWPKIHTTCSHVECQTTQKTHKATNLDPLHPQPLEVHLSRTVACPMCQGVKDLYSWSSSPWWVVRIGNFREDQDHDSLIPKVRIECDYSKSVLALNHVRSIVSAGKGDGRLWEPLFVFPQRCNVIVIPASPIVNMNISRVAQNTYQLNCFARFPPRVWGASCALKWDIRNEGKNLRGDTNWL